MMNTIAIKVGALERAFFSEERSADIPEPDDLYGWLVGSWELEVCTYWGDVSKLGLKAEAHFGWVLEGRAIQDVWIIPRPEQRAKLPNPALFSYGTTLRVWDPKLRAWQVTWINPVTGTHVHLVGRRIGKDIVQIGTNQDGLPICWSFVDITENSFRWTGETLDSDGKTWLLQGDFIARRKETLLGSE